MGGRQRRVVRSLLGRAGYEVQRVRNGTWLVQRSGGKKRPLTPLHIGSAKADAVLLLDDDGTAKRMRKHRNALSDYLAREHLAWVLERLRIDCVLDVGANQGQFAHRLRDLGYAGRIVSFEPVSLLLADLQRAAAKDPEWLALPYALGDEDGTAEINVVPGKMSSLLAASEFGRDWATKLRDSHTETVEVRRLDSVLDEATAGLPTPRIFLKLDTQGYDLQAFRGAGDRQSDMLALQSELACVPIYEGMPRMPEQLSEYESAGFEVSAISPVTKHRKSMRVIEFDVLMVRSEGVATDPG
jgi:FkbM family methyltransferase